MHSLPDPTPPIDLNRPTEALRRLIYDRIAALQWEADPDAATDPEAYQGPTFTPDDAGLTVFYAFARWFAVWTDLDEPADAPGDVRVQVLRVIANPAAPHGLGFEEV